jgi:hypothetical protein
LAVGLPVSSNRRTVDIDGVSVSVSLDRSIVVVSRVEQMVDTALIGAPLPGLGDFALTAYAGSYFFALGRKDVTLGNVGFDDRYIVKTDHAAMARHWFTDDECAAVLATYDPHATDPFRLVIKPGLVLLEATARQAMDGELGGAPAADARQPFMVHRIDEATHAAAAVANRGRTLASWWRDRLASRGLIESGARWRTDDDYVLTLAHGRHSVRIDFPWQLAALARRGLRTRCAIEWPDAARVAIWPSQSSRRDRPRLDDAAAWRLPSPWRAVGIDTASIAALPDLAARLTGLGVDWLLAGDLRLAIGWERIVDDADRLAQASATLARWAESMTASDAPYR